MAGRPTNDSRNHRTAPARTQDRNEIVSLRERSVAAERAQLLTDLAATAERLGDMARDPVVGRAIHLTRLDQLDQFALARLWMYGRIAYLEAEAVRWKVLARFGIDIAHDVKPVAITEAHR